jgi:hypothetical protein
VSTWIWVVVGCGEADLNRIKQNRKSKIIILYKNAWGFGIVPKSTFRGGQK